MVQDQLVEYVSSQLKLGVSRDAIKSALTSVGWAPLDVEDTLKKVEGGTMPAAVQPAGPQKPMDSFPGSATQTKVVSFSAPGTVVGQTKSSEPQTIRVSDLVSTALPASSMPSGTAPKMMSSGPVGTVRPVATITKDPSPKMAPMGTSPAFTASMGQKKKGLRLFEIIAIILIVVLGAFAGYLFVQNNTLNGELQVNNTGAMQTYTNKLQSAATQLEAANASNTALMANVASLTVANQDLAMNLSFLVAPTSSPSPATSTQVSVSGVLSAGTAKNPYVLTTGYGVTVYARNPAESLLLTNALQPLLGDTIQISGTYVPGTSVVTVTAVNGVPLAQPSVATTTAMPVPASMPSGTTSTTIP